MPTSRPATRPATGPGRATARAWLERGQQYSYRPVVPEHVIPILLFLAAQDGRSVTGMLYPVPDWNYDHGYGDYAAWQDHSLPPDMEEMYGKLEAAMPKVERSGVPHAPFDALLALYVSAMTKMAQEKP